MQFPRNLNWSEGSRRDLASHADVLRSSSRIPNAWQTPKNVCVGGEVRLSSHRFSLTHFFLNSLHFSLVVWTKWEPGTSLVNSSLKIVHENCMSDYTGGLNASHCKVHTDLPQIFYHTCKMKQSVHACVSKVNEYYKQSRNLDKLLIILINNLSWQLICIGDHRCVLVRCETQIPPTDLNCHKCLKQKNQAKSK